MTKSELIKVLDKVEGDPEISVSGEEIAAVILTVHDGVSRVALECTDSYESLVERGYMGQVPGDASFLLVGMEPV
jgi:hypothetical protein